MECIKGSDWVNQLTSNDKVLLINPPIQEVRYAWVKWNQPTDLLLLSSKLKKEVGCAVELMDFMLPSDIGRVAMRDLSRKKVVGSERTTYRTRTYGMPVEEAKRNLINLKHDWIPTHIVITTLTSYWYESLVGMIPFLRTIIPSVKITLIGSYPIIETEHAKKIRTDYLVVDSFDFSDVLPDFDLYFEPKTKLLNSERIPSFGGLRFNNNYTSKDLFDQVDILRKRNVRDFVIFTDNIFRDDCLPLSDFLDYLDKEDVKISLHGLCGLQTSDAKDGIYNKMQKGGYRSFYLEYDLVDFDLNLDSYRRAYIELVKQPAARIQSGNLAGFIMIGTPDDDLERMFKHSLNLLEICGSIIPKPFTPTPNTSLYKEISAKGLEMLSPHVFPLAERTGISRAEYMEFYKHTTFLNEKRMGVSFDFFDNRYSSVALKRSLGKKEGAF